VVDRSMSCCRPPASFRLLNCGSMTIRPPLIFLLLLNSLLPTSTRRNTSLQRRRPSSRVGRWHRKFLLNLNPSKAAGVVPRRVGPATLSGSNEISYMLPKFGRVAPKNLCRGQCTASYYISIFVNMNVVSLACRALFERGPPHHA